MIAARSSWSGGMTMVQVQATGWQGSLMLSNGLMGSTRSETLIRVTDDTTEDRMPAAAEVAAAARVEAVPPGPPLPV